MQVVDERRQGRSDLEAALGQRAQRKLARSRRINADTHDRRVMLKIKLKSLAAEARMIRREELLRQGGWLRSELHRHRIGDVRAEARATHLAYGFLRGLPRSRMETRSIPAAVSVSGGGTLRKKVRDMVKRYGDGKEVADAWFEEV